MTEPSTQNFGGAERSHATDTVRPQSNSTMAGTVSADVRGRGQELNALQVWIEISVFDHWGPKPHGIPRVTQNIFIESLRRPHLRYFYYHPIRERFVVVEDPAYFLALARGERVFNPLELPDGSMFADALSDGARGLFSAVGWDHPGYFEQLCALRRRCPGLMVQFVVYDLIAIKYPHFFTREFGGRVQDFLRLLPLVCDRFMCISHSTASDVRALLKEDADTRVISIGGDVDNVDARGTDTRPTAAYPFVLCVGTLEVRKNHLLLYYVWRKLAQHLGLSCPKLVLVGRPGWLSGDVVYLLLNDPLTAHLVEIRHDVSNHELVTLFKDCLFTVFPSFYEGWGLPAWESLFYGKVCATSNTASLPEINPFPQLMFDPYDHNQAFDVIRMLIEEPDTLARYETQIPLTFRSRTWRACFDELYQQMVA
ncbi:glycosyltransferase family 4 protein [Burkholderia multivorans]|uniref:Glycosyltransferase family 4 protein n=1 Tax=Burkholderia multivorans TaxID=87883 RepID=A0AAP2HF39_9BURK|nr:glycosyltransferase family 1 protein [Burkholderia multivorans]MBU9355027.1 glycosyltransferase family 4 protein [Burkholderia multivorans]